MSAAAIGGVAPALTTTDASNKFAELSSSDFIRIIVQELTNQDPLAPQDTGALLEQLSSLRNIESQTALSDQLESLVTQNALSTSASLIGKTVQYESEIPGLEGSGSIDEAKVESISLREGRVTLNLDNGLRLPADKVVGVTAGG